MPDTVTQRAVVSNTGPFISLEQIPNGFELLKMLFDKVLIPDQVLSELAYDQESPKDYLKKFQLDNLVNLVEVETPSSGLESLDYGEKFAITLAEQKQLPILLEDRAARRIADKRGLKVFGAAGLLKKAHEEQMLSTDEAVEKLTMLYHARRIPKRIFLQVGNMVIGKSQRK